MRALRMLFFVGLAFIFVSSSLIYADVPQMINYQGKITTPAGALIDTSVQMIFTIYDDSTSGNTLWADTLSSVAVEKGVFSVLLGSGNPIPDSVFDGDIRYLGTKVGTDAEMSPRKAMVSVAYAYRTGGDGDWTVSGNDLYRRDGNVGIGTDNPLTSLYVYRDTNAFVGISIENRNTESNSCEGIYFWNEDIGVAGIRLFDEGHASYPARMNIFNNRPDGSIHFGTAGQLSRMTVANDGNTGIGTTSPDEKLHVVGNIKMVDGNQAAGYVLTSDANGVGTWQAVPGGGIGGSGTTNYLPKFTGSTALGNSVLYENAGKIGLGTMSPGADLDIVSTNPNLRLSTTSGSPVITLDKASGNWGYLEFREGGASKWQAGVTTGNDYYILNWPSSKYVFYANSAGDVGIGTTSPDERLHVVGNIKMVDGNQAAGYVLTSDANGVGTWQATAGGGGWVDDGTVVRLETSTDTVGIGTTSPGANLDIVSTNPHLRLGTASGSPLLTFDKATGNTSMLEFREAGASKWQAGVSTTNDYYILNWPASQYVFFANSAGDVGIGTTSPSEKLTVNGDIDMIQGQSRIHGTGEMSFDWSAGSTYDNPSQHGFESKDEAGTWGDEIRVNSMNDIINTVDANDNDATSYFKVQHHSTGDGEDLFWVRSSDGYAYHKGRLGIGTTGPGADLDIVSANPNLRLSTTSGSPVITLDKASGYWGYLEFRDGGASKWQAGVTSGNDYYILNWPASKYVFYANSAGNVGIGTTSPTGKLDVNGDDIRIRSSQTPASASADGYTGEIAWDSNYIYICTSGDGPGGGTDSWKRAALSTW